MYVLFIPGNVSKTKLKKKNNTLRDEDRKKRNVNQT